jgi:hypothetical protein
MYYDLFGSGLMRSYDATAFGLSNALTNPAAVLSVATAPGYTAVDRIPGGLLPAPPPAKFPAEYPNLFTIGRGLDDTIQPPYNMNLNFSIGREFSGGWFVQGTYVGRLSRRSLVRRDAAMPTDLKDPKSGQTYFQAASILARQVNAGVPTASVQPVPFWENLFSNIATSSQTATQVAYSRFNANQYDWTYALYQLDTGAGYGGCEARNRCANTGPWTFYNPQFSYMSVFSSIAGGNYHGAQLNVRKRFKDGDEITMNYTFSKSIDLRSWVERAASSTGVLWNPWQPGFMKGVSDYDNTHLFNMLGVYNLPFGRGQKYGTACRVGPTPSWAAGRFRECGAGPAGSPSASPRTVSGPPTGTTTTGRSGTEPGRHRPCPQHGIGGWQGRPRTVPRSESGARQLRIRVAGRRGHPEWPARRRNLQYRYQPQQALHDALQREALHSVALGDVQPDQHGSL